MQQELERALRELDERMQSLCRDAFDTPPSTWEQMLSLLHRYQGLREAREVIARVFRSDD